jgi:DtxR family transcriptional regulator, Mn-dependent transcriptional regulator
MKLTIAMEDYLEALLSLQEKGIETRIKYLAKELGIKPPSVIDMIKILVAKGYVTQENRKEVLLTEKGLSVAKKIHNKHYIIKDFFCDILGINEEVANNEACKIEHYLSQETYQKLLNYVEHIKKTQQNPLSWINN